MPNNTLLIASDHAGFELKEKLEAWLREMGYDVNDLGTESEESTDYADYAHPLAQRVSDGVAERGVLLCGTGLGMSYVANRYPHVRAAVAWSPEIAELSRRHNLAAKAEAIGAAVEHALDQAAAARLIAERARAAESAPTAVAGTPPRKVTVIVETCHVHVPRIVGAIMGKRVHVPPGPLDD